MRIEVIQTEAGWSALAEDWKRLVAANHISSPFLHYEFQRAWWSGLGGGEWSGAEPFIVLGYGEDSDLRAIAPLFSVEGEQGRSLRLIGSHEIADFLDVICRAEDLPNFLAAWLDYLLNKGAETWDSLDLWNLLQESQTLPMLQQVAEQRSLEAREERLQASPYIAIPDTLDVYFENLASRDAQELRRKLRRAARYPVPIELEILSSEDDYKAGMESFFELMGKEAEKAAFLQGPMAEQMRAIGEAAFGGGWGQLAFLRIGHRRVAGYLNFDYAGRIWAYNAGFDPEFSELSPGWLLMAKMVEWCIDNEREVFDFMRGDEGYKYRFGGQDRFVQRLQITCRSGKKGLK